MAGWATADGGAARPMFAREGETNETDCACCLGRVPEFRFGICARNLREQSREQGRQAACRRRREKFHAKVPEGSIAAVARESAAMPALTAIKDRRPGDGFVTVVDLCGAELARHFPPNELADKVVEI
jgi:hypothetical protein